MPQTSTLPNLGGTAQDFRAAAVILVDTLRSVKIIPEGADQPSLPIPDEIVFSGEDEERAHQGFDAYVKAEEPDWNLEGLLSSDVLREEEEEEGATDVSVQGRIDQALELLGISPETDE